MMDVDGSNQIRLTHHSASALDPGRSPDGTKIAFESDRDSDPRFLLMAIRKGQAWINNETFYQELRFAEYW